MAECKAFIGFKEDGQWREESSASPGETGGPISLPAKMRIRVEGCEAIESVDLYSTLGNTVVPPSEFQQTPDGLVAEIEFGLGGPRPGLHIFAVTLRVFCDQCDLYVVRNMYVLQGKPKRLCS
jgi:hypothetical protein